MNKMLLRELLKQKVQTTGIVLMVALWAVIASFLLIIFLHNSEFEEVYFEQSKIEDFSFIPNIDYLDKIEDLSSQYQFTYESRYSVDFDENGEEFRVLENTREIDKAYIVKGKTLEDEGSILINQEYGKDNHIEAGDSFELQGKTYIVSGLFTTPDYLQMHVREGLTTYDAESQALIIVSDDDFKNFEGEQNLLYIAKFGSELSDNQKENLSKEMTLSGKFNQLVFRNDNSNISIYSSKNKIYKLVAYITVGVLANIVGLLIVLFLYTNIRNNKKQIGILKANGFKDRRIFLNYFFISFILIVPAAIIGCLIGFSLSPYINKLLMSDISIPASPFNFNLELFIVITLFNVYISLIATVFGVIVVLNQPVIELMKSKNIKQVTKFEKVILKLYQPRNFWKKIKISFAIRSKLIIFLVVFSSFAAGIQFYMTAIFYQLPETVQHIQSSSMDYTNEVHIYQSDEKLIIQGQYFKQSTGVVYKDSNGMKASIIGLEEGNLIKLNQGNTSLNDLLDEGAIINKVLSRNLNIKVNDNIEVQINYKKCSIPVVGISDRVVGREVFIGYNYMVEHSLIDNGFNGFYTNEPVSKSDDPSIVSIISKEQTINNLESTKVVMQSASKILLVLGTLIPVIILIVSVTFLVASNKNEISTLEANGFQSKQIDKLIYRSFDGFMLIGILISVPYTYFLLSMIFTLASRSSGIYYPVDMSITTILFGVIMTSIVYFATLFIVSRQNNLKSV